MTLKDFRLTKNFFMLLAQFLAVAIDLQDLLIEIHLIFFLLRLLLDRLLQL